MASKPQKTLGDYVAIAISPGLIMVLVGSLVFFLLELAYQGRFEARVRWILFWFVFASVLIARLGIEQGREHARIYGLALAVATALVIMQFVDQFLIAWVLLGVVWWCANKLTWDCTLIDDKQDASGQGLLQVAGIDAGDADGKQSGQRADAESHDAEPANRKRKPETKLDRWRKQHEKRDEKSRQPHAPGLWVMYFSLAALPLFGLGQLFISKSEPGARTFAFQLLFCYVLAALGLLLTTSFLGLRRYLRQRRLQMPTAVAGTWVGTGAFIILLILVGAIFLPRPDADYSIAQIGEAVESAVRDASKLALLRDNPGENEGRRIGEADKDRKIKKDDGDQGGGKGQAQPGQGEGKQQDDSDKSSSGKSSSEDGKKSSSSSSSDDAKQQGSDSGESKSSKDQQSGSDSGEQSQKSSKDSSSKQGENAGDEKSSGNGDRQAEGQKKQDAAQDDKAQKDGNKGDKGDGGQQRSAEAQSPNAPSGLAEFLGQLAKWTFYGVMILLIAWLVYRYWSQIVASLVQFWRSLMEMLAGLFGQKKRESVEGEAAAEAELVREPIPFSAFPNPFATGRADRMSPQDLVRYTFDALEAWAHERNLARDPELTPLEFARLVAARIPEMGDAVDRFARTYAQVAYSGRSVPREQLAPAEKLWRQMSHLEHSAVV